MTSRHSTQVKVRRARFGAVMASAALALPLSVLSCLTRHPTPSSNMSDANDRPAYQAAHATLLALVASLPTGADVDGNRVVILPESDVISWDDAASLIASLRKPVECTAEARDGILRVTCSDITDPDRRFLLDVQNRSIDQGEGPVGAVLRGDSPAFHSREVALLLGRRESLRLTFPALEYWWRNYLIALPLMIGNRVPDEAERAAGAAAVIVLERGEDIR
jgi:hypothetical protein